MGVSINPLRVDISLNSAGFCGSHVLKPGQSRSRGSIPGRLHTTLAYLWPSHFLLQLQHSSCSSSRFAGRITIQVRSVFEERNLPLNCPLFSLINGRHLWVCPFDCNTWGVGRYEGAGRSCLADRRATACDHVYPIRDIIYNWYTSRPALQLESTEIATTAVTSHIAATAGAPLPRISWNVHRFWERFTSLQNCPQ